MAQSDRISKTFEYSDIGINRDGALTLGDFTAVPDITNTPDEDRAGAVEAWFLGPKAENADLLRDLIDVALKGIVESRRTHFPEDPKAISDDTRAGAAFLMTADTVRSGLEELVAYLAANEVPFSSLRYQGHMLSDTTLPAFVGYLAGMLQNSNTATMQASAATTPLAMLVGWDICNMIGYRGDMGILPWSHMTSNGTIANLEAVWAHREARFLPVAARLALLNAEKTGAPLARARDLMITTCSGNPVRLLAATAWDLSNITLDEALTIPQRLAMAAGLPSRFDAWNAILPLCLNSVGWPNAANEILNCRGGAELGGPPVIIVPSTKHYSWPKAAAAMGIGADRLVDVFVDADARMDMARLRERLDDCLERRIPVQTVVAVVGSTQESAVDPVHTILALREEYRLRGLDFAVHLDAAWGGYMLTRLRKDFTFTARPDQADPNKMDKDPETQLHKNVDPFIPLTDDVPIADDVIDAFKALRGADSITIDPHKWGYVQYPAGSITYRNGEIRRLTTFTGAYIGGAASVKPGEPTVGIFGLEGSRPGAAAASVFLSHRCIRPSVSGHGQLIERSMINAKKFLARLWCMNNKGLPFMVIPLARLPSERQQRVDQADVALAGRDIEIALLRDRIIGRSIDEIRTDAAVMTLLKMMGPDQNVVDYAFNLLDAYGKPQKSIDLFNRFNARIHDTFHITRTGLPTDEPGARPAFIMTKTIFQRATYGDDFIDTFAGRLGLVGASGARPDAIFCLRSTIMNPMLADAPGANGLAAIFDTLEDTIAEIAGLYRDRIE